MELEEDGEEGTEKRNNKRKVTTPKAVKATTSDIPEGSMGESSTPLENSAELQDTVIKDAFFPCPETFLQVGDVVQASGIGVSEGVQNIWKDGSSYTCEGFVIDKTDFCISGPTKKVDKASVHFSRYVKQTLKGATKKAFHASQEKSKHDYVYRKAVRTGHLRQACSGGSRKSS
ncbi:uncharacterized protein [Apostichopus japonicus]|uniref:uncharacterized protein isoform X2 n=1 Tax=Stichopus japonicus TaxID=307972 RepID=UPI003AB135F8